MTGAEHKPAPDARLPAALYVVATPIGNLDDVSARALSVLGRVDRTLAEDTRTTRRLLQRYGIDTPLRALHEHNEQTVSAALAAEIAAGACLALVSDAGTPLLSDPGYRLVNAVIDAGARVVPVPGPSAVTAALSAAGMATDRFSFEGFAPSRAAARREWLHGFARATHTVVLFEAPHRLLALLDDVEVVLGAERPLCVAREVTKQFETFLRGTVAHVNATVRGDPNQQRGECVVLIGGVTPSNAALPATVEVDVDALLGALAEALPLRAAVRVAAAATGQGRNALYERALALRE